MTAIASLVSLSSRLAIPFGLYHRPTKADLVLAARAQASVDFTLLLPSTLPLGYSLVGTRGVEFARDLVMMTFAGPRRKSFRLTERRASMSLRTELAGAGIPHEAVRFANQDFELIGGEFVGEPVDLWHWHTTRRAISWEQGGVICEIGAVVAEAPSLRQCLQIAAAVQPLTRFQPSPQLQSAKGVDVSP